MQYQETTPELEAWLEAHHRPGWVPGKNGGRIIKRDRYGRVSR